MILSGRLSRFVGCKMPISGACCRVFQELSRAVVLIAE